MRKSFRNCFIIFFAVQIITPISAMLGMIVSSLLTGNQPSGDFSSSFTTQMLILAYAIYFSEETEKSKSE